MFLVCTLCPPLLVPLFYFCSLSLPFLFIRSCLSIDTQVLSIFYLSSHFFFLSKCLFLICKLCPSILASLLYFCSLLLSSLFLLNYSAEILSFSATSVTLLSLFFSLHIFVFLICALCPHILVPVLISTYFPLIIFSFLSLWLSLCIPNLVPLFYVYSLSLPSPLFCSCLFIDSLSLPLSPPLSFLLNLFLCFCKQLEFKVCVFERERLCVRKREREIETLAPLLSPCSELPDHVSFTVCRSIWSKWPCHSACVSVQA